MCFSIVRLDTADTHPSERGYASKNEQSSLSSVRSNDIFTDKQLNILHQGPTETTPGRFNENSKPKILRTASETNKQTLKDTRASLEGNRTSTMISPSSLSTKGMKTEMAQFVQSPHNLAFSARNGSEVRETVDSLDSYRVQPKNPAERGNERFSLIRAVEKERPSMDQLSYSRSNLSYQFNNSARPSGDIAYSDGEPLSRIQERNEYSSLRSNLSNQQNPDLAKNWFSGERATINEAKESLGALNKGTRVPESKGLLDQYLKSKGKQTPLRGSTDGIANPQQYSSQQSESQYLSNDPHNSYVTQDKSELQGTPKQKDLFLSTKLEEYYSHNYSQQSTRQKALQNSGIMNKSKEEIQRSQDPIRERTSNERSEIRVQDEARLFQSGEMPQAQTQNRLFMRYSRDNMSPNLDMAAQNEAYSRVNNNTPFEVAIKQQQNLIVGDERTNNIEEQSSARFSQRGSGQGSRGVSISSRQNDDDIEIQEEPRKTGEFGTYKKTNLLQKPFMSKTESLNQGVHRNQHSQQFHEEPANLNSHRSPQNSSGSYLGGKMANSGSQSRLELNQTQNASPISKGAKPTEQSLDLKEKRKSPQHHNNKSFALFDNKKQGLGHANSNSLESAPTMKKSSSGQQLSKGSLRQNSQSNSKRESGDAEDFSQSQSQGRNRLTSSMSSRNQDSSNKIKNLKQTQQKPHGITYMHSAAPSRITMPDIEAPDLQDTLFSAYRNEETFTHHDSLSRDYDSFGGMISPLNGPSHIHKSSAADNAAILVNSSTEQLSYRDGKLGEQARDSSLNYSKFLTSNKSIIEGKSEQDMKILALNEIDKKLQLLRQDESTNKSPYSGNDGEPIQSFRKGNFYRPLVICLN